MKKLFLAGLALAYCVTGNAIAAGKDIEITVDSLASEWDSMTMEVPGVIIPVGGAGQINGNFTIVERTTDGVEIGLRATDRTDGLLPPATGKNKGVYQASTGFDGVTDNRAEWNYDWHVDLRGTGTSLKDYKLTLTQTFVPKLTFGAVTTSGPVDLAFRETLGGFFDNVLLYQQSWNPLFFNEVFDVDVEGVYNIKLTLAPIEGGTPLIARIQVVVSDPI